jgi:hypothetical protein
MRMRIEQPSRRFQYGAIYDVPEPIAVLWYERGIAVPEEMHGFGVEPKLEKGQKIKEVKPPKRDKKKEKNYRVHVRHNGELVVKERKKEKP